MAMLFWFTDVVKPRARCQHERRVNAIAIQFDRDSKAGSRIPRDAPCSDERSIERQNDGATERCKESRERLDGRLWCELGHLYGKQAAEHTKEKGAENTP